MCIREDGLINKFKKKKKKKLYIMIIKCPEQSSV